MQKPRDLQHSAGYGGVTLGAMNPYGGEGPQSDSDSADCGFEMRMQVDDDPWTHNGPGPPTDDDNDTDDHDGRYAGAHTGREANSDDETSAGEGFDSEPDHPAGPNTGSWRKEIRATWGKVDSYLSMAKA